MHHIKATQTKVFPCIVVMHGYCREGGGAQSHESAHKDDLASGEYRRTEDQAGSSHEAQQIYHQLT